MQKLKIKLNIPVIILIILGILILTGFFLYPNANRYFRQIKSEQAQEEAIKLIEPVETSQKPIVDTQTTETKLKTENPKPQIVIPSSYNVEVPFTSQAPFAIWNERDEEACEEASLLMAAEYYDKTNLKIENNKIDPNQVDQELNKIIDWENKNIGEWKSTTIEQTAKVARDYFGLKTEIKNLSFDEIKKSLVQNKLVILPGAGRKLNNPNFKTPGPLYHMLLVKGWNDDNFITNDPGTKKGANFVYSKSNLETAVHDWNNGDVDNGAQLMLIVN